MNEELKKQARKADEMMGGLARQSRKANTKYAAELTRMSARLGEMVDEMATIE